MSDFKKKLSAIISFLLKVVQAKNEWLDKIQGCENAIALKFSGLTISALGLEDEQD